MSYTEFSSYVWPPDYNWFPVTDITNFPQQHVSNASLLYPWLLSMWAVGAFDSKRNPKTTNKMIAKNVQYPRASFKEVIKWKLIDIKYPNARAKEEARRSGRFIPENNLPLGVHAYKNRIFVTLPKWKEGVPITLGVVGKDDGPSPEIKPYPDWSWHTAADCQGLTSVFRVDIDECNRLWVMDSGVVDAENTVNQLCAPQIFVFSLDTDRLLWRYSVPREQSPDSSLLSNIVVEVLNGDCLDAYAYLGDVFRYGLIVYSYKMNRSWRLTHSYFYPDPLASDYVLDRIAFQWVDGLFGMALSPPDNAGNRLLYFHPLSSYREFSVPTYVLRNETLGFAMNRFFKIVGEPRGDSVSHSTGSAMDRNGVMFYNLLTKSGVACWNLNRMYTPATQGLLYQNNETLSFPNDLRVDLESNQYVWVLSNRLHRFLYDRLDPNDVNFRILSADAKNVVKGTVCDPETVQ